MTARQGTLPLKDSEQGTVTSVSVVTANGLAGTVATATTTPAITLSTTISGVLKGNGTAISAATAGTDYAPATSGSSILYGNGSGGFSNVSVGTGLDFTAGSLTNTGGTVTHTAGALTASAVVVGNGTDDVKVLASLGTTTTVLHGNAAGLPTFGAVVLTADVSGILPGANGGTGVANTGFTITLGGNLATSGAFASTFTMTNTTTVTFPTTGTLATLAGSETFTNKVLTNPTVTDYVESVVAIGNSGTSKTIDLTTGTFQTVTMTGNCTFTMPSAVAGKSFILLVSTGAGSFTGAFTSVKWPGNTAPTLTATASRWDMLSFASDGTNWYGNFAQAYQ